MIKALTISTIAALLFVPGQIQPPHHDPITTMIMRVDWFTPPSGPLPWSVPVYPDTTLDVSTPSTTLNDVEHSAAYASQISDMESRYAAIETPIEDANTFADTWINGDELPDMTSGDFDTGLNPTGSGSMQASEFATELASNVGLVYQYIRLLTSIDLGGTAYALGFILLCIAWMMFLTFVKFAIQIADMVYSVAVSIIELIPVVE